MITIPNQTKPRISGADIVVTPGMPRLSCVKTDRERAADAWFFANLRSVKAQCGDNQNDQAFAAIALCIEYGIDTRECIRAALAHVGFDIRHVTIILNKMAGADPTRFPWHRDDEGRYHLNI